MYLPSKFRQNGGESLSEREREKVGVKKCWGIKREEYEESVDGNQMKIDLKNKILYLSTFNSISISLYQYFRDNVFRVLRNV